MTSKARKVPKESRGRSRYQSTWLEDHGNEKVGRLRLATLLAVLASPACRVPETPEEAGALAAPAPSLASAAAVPSSEPPCLPPSRVELLLGCRAPQGPADAERAKAELDLADEAYRRNDWDGCHRHGHAAMKAAPPGDLRTQAAVLVSDCRVDHAAVPSSSKRRPRGLSATDRRTDEAAHWLMCVAREQPTPPRDPGELVGLRTRLRLGHDIVEAAILARHGATMSGSRDEAARRSAIFYLEMILNAELVLARAADDHEPRRHAARIRASCAREAQAAAARFVDRFCEGGCPGPHGDETCAAFCRVMRAAP